MITSKKNIEPGKYYYISGAKKIVDMMNPPYYADIMSEHSLALSYDNTEFEKRPDELNIEFVISYASLPRVLAELVSEYSSEFVPDYYWSQLSIMVMCNNLIICNQPPPSLIAYYNFSYTHNGDGPYTWIYSDNKPKRQ